LPQREPREFGPDIAFAAGPHGEGLPAGCKTVIQDDRIAQGALIQEEGPFPALERDQ
jgi:hypothetical protein